MMLALATDLLARAKDGEGVKSGPLGLAIILVLCVACYFLFKSMSKHMRKVREEFPSDEAQRPSADTTAAGDAPAQPDGSARSVATTPPADPS